MYNGFSLSNMKEAPEEIRSRLKALDDNPTCRCRACRAELRGHSVFTADAGQAYEMLSPSLIKLSLQKLERRVAACKSKDQYFTVYNGSKSLVAGRGPVVGSFGDRLVLASGTIFTALRALMRLKTYVCGDQFLIQQKGIPIGGPVSGEVLNHVLSVIESEYIVYKWQAWLRRRGLPWDVSFVAWICTCRYVDDLLMISKCLCVG